MNDVDFSLILACYNEEGVLEKSVKKIEEIFNKTKLRYEVIFVDDKSADNTVNIIKGTISTHPGWRLIEHKKNTGRGRAVSDGIKASNAPIVGFIDIDLSTSPWYLVRLIHEIEKGADIATAMRVYKLKPRTLFRWILSKGYNFIMRLILKCNLLDTETGCKVFNKSRIKNMLDTVNAEHWFWDTEIMLRSYVRGYKIVEVPTIFIRESLSTTVHIFTDIKNYLINLAKFRRELQRIRKNAV